MRIVPIFAALAVCAVPAAPMIAKTMAKPMAMSAASYVMKAGASDLYEIQSSKLVLATTQNAALKSFAQEMIADHTKSTADVKAAAAAAGMKVAPPKLDAMQAKMIAQLTAASGALRDSVYIMQQKKSHAMALSLQQSYASVGTVASLRAAAAKIVPVVQMHIGMLDGM